MIRHSRGDCRNLEEKARVPPASRLWRESMKNKNDYLKKTKLLAKVIEQNTNEDEMFITFTFVGANTQSD
jgi:hypothetical protein